MDDTSTINHKEIPNLGLLLASNIFTKIENLENPLTGPEITLLDVYHINQSVRSPFKNEIYFLKCAHF